MVHYEVPKIGPRIGPRFFGVFLATASVIAHYYCPPAPPIANAWCGCQGLRVGGAPNLDAPRGGVNSADTSWLHVGSAIASVAGGGHAGGARGLEVLSAWGSSGTL